MATFEGLGVALITPFDQNGKIDFDRLEKLLDFQIEGGVDYIVVLGTTAETPTLSPDERAAICRFVVAKVNGRVPLVVGCGGNSTDAIIHELETTDFTGFSAILSVVPFYNKPTQDGIYAHFAAIAKASPLPVILYNIPGRTGVNMLPATTLRLANEFHNIVAIKEASGNVVEISRLVAAKPKDFTVISGDDSLTLPLMAVGCAGVISVAANALPRQMKALITSVRDNRLAEAARINCSLLECFRLMFADGNPAGIKAALSSMGMIENILRLPLVPATDATASALGRAIEAIRKN